MELTYADQIRAVKSLVQERWSQGHYFISTREGPCCCVHGAAQYVCNPRVKDLLRPIFSPYLTKTLSQASCVDQHHQTQDHVTMVDKDARSQVMERANRIASREAAGMSSHNPGRAARVAANAVGQNRLSSSVDNVNDDYLIKIWMARPNWVRYQDPIHSLNLHYLLGMFGITPGFNDAESTTLGVLLSALDRCIVWVEENQEFLQAN